MAAASVTPPGSLDLLQPGFSKTLLGTKLEDKYLCSACKNVLRRPFQAQCGHRYCSFCLSSILRWARGGAEAVVSSGQSSRSSVSLVGTAQSDRAAGSQPFCAGRPRPRGAGRRGRWLVLRTVVPSPRVHLWGALAHTALCLLAALLGGHESAKAMGWVWWLAGAARHRQQAHRAAPPSSSGPQSCAACVHEGIYEEGVSILESSSVSEL